ncbi:MAG: LytR/AlgR family response regulator transcription factor [Gammaproteobacteria bacterium]
MKVLLVDDEPLARDRLRALLADLGETDIVAEGGSGQAAIELTRQYQPDVLLLDIRMPGIHGIEAANHIARMESPPAVIFTTAYDEHALAAFDANAIDYLLKPIRGERLEAALKKAQALTVKQTESIAELQAGKRQHVSGMVKGNLVIVNLAEIFFFQSDQGYTRVVWEKGELLIEDSLKSLEDEFGDEFIRIHRNALVRVDKVAEIARETTGNQLVRLRGIEEILPVSRRMVSGLRRRIRELGK